MFFPTYIGVQLSSPYKGVFYPLSPVVGVVYIFEAIHSLLLCSRVVIEVHVCIVGCLLMCRVNE